MIQSYSDFKNTPASEKIVLVILEAAKRLMGWTLHSGSVYKLTGFDYSVIQSIEDSGTAYVSVSSIADVTAGKFYNDRTNKILYLRASNSSNPNSRFLAMTFQMFFANVPVTVPYDLGSGKEVLWLPYVKKTSEFGTALDNQYQMGEAIEGTGSLTFYNEQSFWAPIFDKLYFENQRAFVYSWNRDVPIASAQLLFRGRIQMKSYNPTEVSFTVADILNELRSSIPLSLLSAFPGARVSTRKGNAFQRLVYGHVFGHRPTNIDEVLDAYPMTGTASITAGNATLTGSGTQFLKELSPGDTIFVGSDTTEYAVKQVDSDTSAILTEVYANPSVAGASLSQRPSHPKRWMNRVFHVAGHAIREISTTVASADRLDVLTVTSASDLRAGDAITVNGENTAIRRLYGTTVQLTTSLASLPQNGDPVVRPGITNVRLDDRLLQLTRDYTYDHTLTTLTLDELAEVNVAPFLVVRTGTVAFTNGSRTVTGTSTTFKSDYLPGDWIGAVGQADQFEILSIDSETQITLRTVATYTVAGAVLSKKSPNIYEEDTVILSCDCLGKVSSGTLIATGPMIVRDILRMSSTILPLVDDSSFTTASNLAGQRVGLVIPTTYSDTKTPTMKNVINRINQSIFGALIENANFGLSYEVFHPGRPSSYLALKEVDILNWSVRCDSDRIAKTAITQYLQKEYDYVSKDASFKTKQATSSNAQYLAKTIREDTISTLLVDETDALIMATRRAFLLEVSSSIFSFKTKLQAVTLKNTDRVSISHEKMYQRIGSLSKIKMAAVNSTKKDGLACNISTEDLANAFSRCASIAEDDALSYSSAPESERLINGYITDSYGMQANDPDTFGINLIW